MDAFDMVRRDAQKKNTIQESIFFLLSSFWGPSLKRFQLEWV